MFEYYTPSVPYFESVHLLRKGSLILLVSTLSTPITQSACNLVVNGTFLLILEYKQVRLIMYVASEDGGKPGEEDKAAAELNSLAHTSRSSALCVCLSRWSISAPQFLKVPTFST